MKLRAHFESRHQSLLVQVRQAYDALVVSKGTLERARGAYRSPDFRRLLWIRLASQFADGLFPPLPPPQTDEDKENDKKLKVRDLIDQVEAEIKSVTEELETARDELASVETRFAQESQSR